VSAGNGNARTIGGPDMRHAYPQFFDTSCLYKSAVVAHKLIPICGLICGLDNGQADSELRLHNT
jgi:hypothetical protein